MTEDVKFKNSRLEQAVEQAANTPPGQAVPLTSKKGEAPPPPAPTPASTYQERLKHQQAALLAQQAGFQRVVTARSPSTKVLEGGAQTSMPLALDDELTPLNFQEEMAAQKNLLNIRALLTSMIANKQAGEQAVLAKPRKFSLKKLLESLFGDTEEEVALLEERLKALTEDPEAPKPSQLAKMQQVLQQALTRLEGAEGQKLLSILQEAKAEGSELADSYQAAILYVAGKQSALKTGDLEAGVQAIVEQGCEAIATYMNMKTSMQKLLAIPQTTIKRRT